MHGSPNVRTHRRNVVYLWGLDWINQGNLVSGTEYSGTSRRSSIKHVTPGSHSKMGTKGSLIVEQLTVQHLLHMYMHHNILGKHVGATPAFRADE